MRLLIFLIILTLSLSSASKPETPRPQSQTHPDISTPSGFLAMCNAVDQIYAPKTQDQQYSETLCIGWVRGVSKGIVVGQIAAIGKVQICFPQINSYGQMLRIIKKYINDHPEQEQYETEWLAFLAMKEAFPCKN
jgi:hypothetical protein